MPTKLRRHAITETPTVAAALAELRREPGGSDVSMAELVVIGAEHKVRELRRVSEHQAVLRERLAERIRTRSLDVDIEAAEYVRAHGWVHE